MTTTTRKSGPGCFFYGCLTSILLLIFAAVGLYFGAKWWIGKQVERFTDSRPMALPNVEYAPAEAQAVRERVEAFTTAIKAGTSTEPLVLDERELNILIASVPEMKELRDKVYVGIEGDRLQGTISLPLETIPFPPPLRGAVKGRYLNGSADLRVSLDNGFFLVALQSLEVKGQVVPEEAMKAISEQNLAKDFYKNQEGMKTLQRLQSISVEDGRLMITPRPAE